MPCNTIIVAPWFMNTDVCECEQFGLQTEAFGVVLLPCTNSALNDKHN